MAQMDRPYFRVFCAVIAVVLACSCEQSPISPNDSTILDEEILIKYEAEGLNGDDRAADKVAMHLGSVGDKVGLKKWISKVARSGSPKYGNIRIREILDEARSSGSNEERYCLLTAAKYAALNIMHSSQDNENFKEAQISFADSISELLNLLQLKESNINPTVQCDKFSTF